MPAELVVIRQQPGMIKQELHATSGSLRSPITGM